MRTVLKIVCMWCHKPMGEKDGLGVKGTSHSICEGCWKMHYPEYEYPEKTRQEGEDNVVA